MKVENCVALITGGASGLGLATAQEIVGRGGKALLVDLNVDAGKAEVADLGALSAFRAADVCDA